MSDKKLQYDNYRWIGKNYVRPDAWGKATGTLPFISDMEPGLDCVYGKLKFADQPHALIKGLDVSEALAMPGVIDVVTADDVPAHNGFGIMSQEHPVFAKEKVSYYGDPICCVIAENEDLAREAVAKIHVEYEPLPANTDVLKSLDPDAPVVFGNSNVIKDYHFKRGDVDKYFDEEKYYVISRSYDTPVQEHGYLETEFAIAQPYDGDGVEIWCPTQYGFQDRWQLCKILGLPPQKIVEHTSPLGGAFGGKDDMALQPIIACCALKLKRRVLISVTREESMRFSSKRVPFHIDMTTSCDRDGKLMAHKVTLYGDMGPYNSVNQNVFDFAVEHACQNYLFEALEVSGSCLRTNHANTSAFRGFGNPQITYCVENQIEELAQLSGFDSVEFRMRNFLKSTDRTNYGTTHTGNQGLWDAMNALKNGWLWTHREEFKAGASKPWLKRGIGLAAAEQGENMGSGVVDAPFGKFYLDNEGYFTYATSIVEMGQGSLPSTVYMLAEALGVDPDIVRAAQSDTSVEADAGGAFASRGTFVNGRTLIMAAKDFLKYSKGYLCRYFKQDVEMKDGHFVTADGTVLSWKEVHDILPPEYRMASGHYVSEETPYVVDFIVHYIYAHCVEIVGVEVNELTGKAEILKREVYPSCGTVINRLGYEGQVEGALAQGQGYGLMEEYIVRPDGIPMTRSFQTYLMPTIRDVVDPEIHIQHAEEELGPYGAKGLGEIPMVTGAAAIGNAIADALGGKHLYRFPCTPERVLKLIEEE